MTLELLAQAGASNRPEVERLQCEIGLLEARVDGVKSGIRSSLPRGFLLPISTTHTLVGAVLGVGLARGIGALKLGVIRTILMSWIITLPAGAALAVIFYYLLRIVFG